MTEQTAVAGDDRVRSTQSDLRFDEWFLTSLDEMERSVSGGDLDALPPVDADPITLDPVAEQDGSVAQLAGQRDGVAEVEDAFGE